MTAPELKPCPFCGLKPPHAQPSRRVVCLCGAAGEWGHSSTDAAEKWNTRADLIPAAALAVPEVRALVERDAELIQEGIEALTEAINDSDEQKAKNLAYAEHTGERPDLWDYQVHIPTDAARKVVEWLSALAALRGEGGNG